MHGKYLRDNCQSLVRGNFWCCIWAAYRRYRGIAYIAGRKNLFSTQSVAELSELIQLEEHVRVAVLNYEARIE